MSDFRPETFLQFIKKTKPYWSLKIIWVSAFMFLAFVFFWTYKTDLNAFWGYFIFCIVALPLQAGFAYWLSYKMYHLGRIAFLDLNDKELKIFNDVNVFVKGFDLFSKKKFYDLNVTKPIYDFEQADIIFSKKSIILLGKSKIFGTITFASPVELFTSKAKTTIANAKLIDWSDSGKRLQIEIIDSNYDKPIKIEFKRNYEEIKPWLTKVFQ
jgi:hypothetical protein